MTRAACPGRAHLSLVTHRVTELEMDIADPLDPSRTFPAPRPRKLYWAIPLSVLTAWLAVGGFALLLWP